MMKHPEKERKNMPNRLPMSDPSRRKFLKHSVGFLLATAAYGSGLAETAKYVSPGWSRPVLENACLEPSTDAEKTLAAVVDTVVPGPTLDPDGDPGGLEACSLNLMFDEYYPFRTMIPELATLFDINSPGGSFVDLDYESRMETLVKVQNEMPILRLAFRAIRSAFFGGAYNGLGHEYVKYPGPNLGYRHILEASFRVPVCQELTDGWMP